MIDVVRPASDSSINPIANRSMTTRMEVYTDIPLPRAFCQRFSFQTHLNGMRTLLALLCFKVDLSKSFRQVILADLPYLGATEATATTWTSCDQPAHILLCVVDSLLSGGVTVPQSNTLCQDCIS